MKPERNPNTNEQENSQKSGMAAPEAASKRDVKEAERKAEDAKTKAVEEAERVHQELREEIDELEAENRALRQVIGILDSRMMKLFEKAKHKSLTKSFSVDESAREVANLWEREEPAQADEA